MPVQPYRGRKQLLTCGVLVFLTMLLWIGMIWLIYKVW
jgi:hypothetical protein